MYGLGRRTYPLTECAKAYRGFDVSLSEIHFSVAHL